MSLQRYPEYKPSENGWYTELPSHWKAVPLARVTLSRCDGPFGSGLKSEHYTDDGIRVIRLQNIRSGWFNDTDAAYIDTAYYQAALEGHDVLAGDVLIAGLGDDNNTVGRAVVAPEGIEPAMVKADCFRFRLDTSAANPNYVSRALSAGAISDAGVMSSGSTRSRIPLGSMATRRIPLPPIPEQIGIVRFIDCETAKIDTLISEQEQLIELLKEKRQAVISHAVTKGLNPQAPMKPSGIDWLGDVPAHWEVTKMKWVAQMESGHTPDKKVPAYWEGGDIPWVSLNDTAHLKDHEHISETAFSVTQLGLDNSSAHVLPAYAVVFSRDATIGRCAITTRPMAVSQHFIAWVCGPSLLPDYLLFRLRSMTFELERLTTGATVKTIGMPEVRSLATPVPPIEEQTAIAAWIRRETSQIDALVNSAERAVGLLQERRAALISAAVTGQIDVRGAA